MIPCINSEINVFINASSSWIGYFWGRTFCSNNSTGTFTCITGDCGSGDVKCSGRVVPPATLAEFNLAYDGGDDYYAVNVINGYNLPLLVTPDNEKCESIGCVVELNKTCPSDLRESRTDIASNAPFACETSCQKNMVPELCCVGHYVKDEDVVPPEQCKRTIYSETFNNACPGAYSYSYDDAKSTFKCAYSPNFFITFCPPKVTKTGNVSLSLKIILILGVASVLGVIAITAFVVMVRANHARKSDRNRKNIDTVVMLKRFS